MISQEEVCTWFENLEACSRIELMCALLDSCLPLELRFLGTYLEYYAGKHHNHLQKWEKEANKTSSWFSSKDFSNSVFRQKFCLFLALLYSHNRTIAIQLFDVLDHCQFHSEVDKVTLPEEKTTHMIQEKEQLDDISKQTCSSDNDSMDQIFNNEMKLLFSMACLHPAFDLLQRFKLRKKKEELSSSCHAEISYQEDILLIENEETNETLTDEQPSTNANTLDEHRFNDETKHTSITLSTQTESRPSLVSVATQTEDLIHPISSANSIVIDSAERPINVQQSINMNIQQAQLTMENVFALPFGTSFPPQMLVSQSTVPLVHHRTVGENPIPEMVSSPPCIVNTPRFISTVPLPNHIPNNKLNSSFIPTEEIMISPTEPLTASQQAPVSFSPVNDESKERTTFDTINIFNNMNNVLAVNIPISTHQPILAPFVQPVVMPFNFPLTSNSCTNTVTSSTSLYHSVGSTVINTSTVNSYLTAQDLALINTITTSKMATLPTRRSHSESDVHDSMNQKNRHEFLASINNNKLQSCTTFASSNNTPQFPHDASLSNVQKHLGMFVHSNNPPLVMRPPNYVNNSNVVFSNISNISSNISNPTDAKLLLTQHPNAQVVQSNNIPVANTAMYHTIPVHTNTVSNIPVVTIQNSAYTSNKQTLSLGLNGTYIHPRYLEQKVTEEVPPWLGPTAIRNNRIENGRNVYTTVSEAPSAVLPMPLNSAPISIQHKDNRNQQQQQQQQFGRVLHDTLDSPFNSPSHSPKPSPLQSPITQRKLNSTPKDTVQENYATPLSWLRSLRLHKYSKTLQDYTFEKMKDLSVDDLVGLELTLGASKKLKQHIDVLRACGFKEFGTPDNLVNTELLSLHATAHHSPSLSPNNNRHLFHRISSTAEALNATYDGASESSSPVSVLNSPSSTVNQCNDGNNEEMRIPNLLSSENYIVNETNTQQLPHSDSVQEKDNTEPVSDKLPNKICKDVDVDSDDEVFSIRKKWMSATCYNCGHAGHYGDECTEQTMESQTYSRYAFQLDYSRGIEAQEQPTQHEQQLIDDVIPTTDNVISTSGDVTSTIESTITTNSCITNR